MTSPADLVRQVIGDLEASPYIPVLPSPRQAVFVGLGAREALYGGAAGGGKTFALLMSALRWVHVPGYHAVMFRRTYPELNDPGGLIPLSKEWLGGTDATFHEGRKQWKFPSGAVLAFKHLQRDADAERVGRGPNYQWMGWDELTTFTEYQYRTPQSRLRRPKSGPLSQVPLQIRAGTNPGGEGHEWVKARFIRDGAREGRPFVASLLTDNPGIDAESYVESLRESLDPILLARMLDGDWDVTEEGEVFDRSRAVIVGPDELPAGLRWTRAWDTAGSVSKSAKYTAGVRMALHDGLVFVSDVCRFRKRPGDRDADILAQAHTDGVETRVLIEHGAGDSGLKQAEDHVRLLAGFNVEVVRVTGDKESRAWPFARQWNAGNVRIVSGPWVGPLLDEAQLFGPRATYKDQIDACSLAFNSMVGAGPSAAYHGAQSSQRRPSGRGQRIGTRSRKVFG